MLVSTLDFSPYIGRIAIGRIERGRVRVGDRVAVLPLGSPGPVDEAEVGMSRVMKLYEFTGLQRLDLEEARAGDIVALAGVEGVEIGTTLTDPESRERLRGIAVEEPTLSVDFSVNDSPFSGRSGKYVTSRQLRDRLFRELERNLALRVEETDSPDTFTVSGRGELHLTILMETMRREGYEFQVSRPRVIAKKAEDGARLEPYEEVVIEVPEGMVGVVMEKMGARGGSVEEMLPTDRGITRLKFRIATRGLFGYRSEFLTDTRGEGVLHHRFLEYGPWVGNDDRSEAWGTGGGPRRGGRGLCPLQPSGAGHHVRDTGGTGLRWDDRRRARSARRHGRECLQGEEGLQHPDHRYRREHPAGACHESSLWSWPWSSSRRMSSSRSPLTRYAFESVKWT